MKTQWTLSNRIQFNIPSVLSALRLNGILPDRTAMGGIIQSSNQMHGCIHGMEGGMVGIFFFLPETWHLTKHMHSSDFHVATVFGKSPSA